MFTFPRATKPIVFVFSLEDSTLVERFITGVSPKLSHWVYAGLHVFNTLCINSFHTLQKAQTEGAD
jgi:hypothetical protein